MNFSTFFTEVSIPVYPFRIECDSRVLIIGSCFADHIGARMGVLRGVMSNPFGVLYNPLSMALCADILHCGRHFDESDLVFRDSLWHSFAHHGSFSAPTTDQVLARINRAAEPSFHYIILTLGTAYVYERDGQVVANCHRFADKEFSRRLASVDECQQALHSIAALYPDARIVVTVSPIRHLRDGLAQNCLSKATLRLAAQQLCDSLPERAFYFPSFEILTDELRDYRFTTPDMCHPTTQAADYIWQRFSDAALSTQTIQTIAAAEREARFSAHRPLH